MEHEANMKGLIGLLAVALIGAAIYWMALTKTQSATGTSGTPAQAISTVGVQNDLLSIAQAERLYQAEHGSYASLDELNSSGALTVQKTGRDGYTYSVETSAGGFTATAKCDSSAAASCTNFAVDQTMQFHATQ
jgi:glycine cleavage system protein P-like pyridoxal-binding family